MADNHLTTARLTPLSAGEPDALPTAENQLRDHQLLHQRADQARVELEKRRDPDTAGSTAAFGDSLSHNLAMKTVVKSKTGEVRSTYESNDGQHTYRGSILGMRQRILQGAADRGETLPANFENYSSAMIVGMFRGMARTGYFEP